MSDYQRQADTMNEAARGLASLDNEDAALVVRASTTNERYRSDPRYTINRLREMATRDHSSSRNSLYRFSRRILDVAGRL